MNNASKPKGDLFLSYGRADAAELADRLKTDLEEAGYTVWQDRAQIAPGEDWRDKIVDGLKHAQVMIAVLSPCSVRSTSDPHKRANADSVCLDEISFARSRHPAMYVVPVMAIPCRAPFDIDRLHFTDMCRWMESKAEYDNGLADVLKGIAAGLRDEHRFSSWADQLRPLDFAPFLYEKRHQFSGREWLFEEIDVWRNSGDGRPLLIAGDPGVGKSAIVAQLVHQNLGGQVLAYHCCQADRKATLQPWRFVRTLAAMIASRLDEYAAQLGDPMVEQALDETECKTDPVNGFEQGILAPLLKIPAPGGRRYLLIDALDEALAVGEGDLNIVKLLATCLKRFPGWLRIVATSRKKPEVLSRLSQLRPLEIDAHDPPNLKDINRFIAMRLNSPKLRERLLASGCSAETVGQALRERSDGNFLYVSQVLLSLESGEIDPGRPEAFPDGLDGIYLKFFERLFPDRREYGDFRPILDVVCAAREPLSVRQIASFLDRQRYDVENDLERVAVFFPEREGRYWAYHQSITRWLRGVDEEARQDQEGPKSKRSRMYRVNLEDGHRLIADKLQAAYLAGDRDPFTLAHLPTHLLELDRWQDLSLAVTAQNSGLMQKWVEQGEGDEGLRCLTGIMRRTDIEAVAKAELATQAARIHSLRGDHDRAQEQLEFALGLTSWWRGRRARVVALHELASLHLYRGDERRAARMYGQALRLCTWGVPVYRDEAAANRIALAMFAFGRRLSPRGIRLTRRAFKDALKVRDFPHVIAAQRVLGITLEYLGAYEKAESVLQTALRLSRQTAIHVETARLLVAIGFFAFCQATLCGKLYSEATAYFRQAMDEALRIHDRTSLLTAKQGLGFCALATGSTEEALRWFAQIEAALPANSFSDLRAWTCMGLAAAAHQEGRLEEAESEYADVVTLARGHRFAGCECNGLIGIGAIHWHLGRRDQAETAWQLALARARRTGSAHRQRLTEVNIELCQAGPTVTPR